MHLIVLAQPENPIVMDPDAVDKFIKKLSAKKFSADHLHESWNRIRAREIRLFDFTIPESVEEEALEYLSHYHAGKITRLRKILENPIIKAIAKRIGLEPVKISRPKDKLETLPGRLVILGKVKDDYKGNLEML